MKNLLQIMGLLILLTVPAFAGPCLPGTLQDYINNGATGCDLGFFTFSDFTDLSPGQAAATPILPTLVQVAPIAGSFTSALQFNVNESAGPGELLESFFRFTATGPLVGVSLLLGPGTATGDGQTNAVLNVCAGGTFLGPAPLGCSGTEATAIVFRTELLESTLEHLDLAAGFFDVFADITIDGGFSGSGSAFLQSVTTEFNAVPEPSTVALVTGGLFLLGLSSLRKARR